jgi:hypothetical protein
LNDTKTDINGLNLYMYCADNPVMLYDPTGCGFWSWVGRNIAVPIAHSFIVNTNKIVNAAHTVGNFVADNWEFIVGVAIIIGLGAATVLTLGAASPFLVWALALTTVGATVGGIYGAYSAKQNGTHIGSGFLSGVITGAALTAATFMPFTATGAALMLGTTFAAGVASYAVETHGNNRQFNAKDMLYSGISTMVQGAFAFTVGHAMGMAGLKGFGQQTFRYLLTQAISGQLGFLVEVTNQRRAGKKFSKQEFLSLWIRYWLP